MFLSVVIPTLNSEKTLGECLASIRAQMLPRSAYEIVLDDAFGLRRRRNRQGRRSQTGPR